MVKGKIAFIFLSVIAVLVAIFLFGVRFQKESFQKFPKKGYIITNDSTQGNGTRYYFVEGAPYKDHYSNQIVFQDVDDHNITVSKDSFVHYNDGSISTLKKSVILNLEDLNEPVIPYYNLFEQSILDYVSGIYYVNHLTKNLKFENFIIKLSDQKYLIASNQIKLRTNQEEMPIQGYAELTFFDGEIVRIENQEVSYQTIGSDVILQISDDYQLDLSTKNIKKGEEIKLNLGQMIIDSDDNIEITPPSEEPEPTPEPDQPSTDQPGDDNQGVVNPSTPSTNPDEEKKIKDPSLRVERMEVSSNKIDAMVTVEDEDHVLTSSLTVTIVETATNKVVYQTEETSGSYQFDVVVENLNPETNYTLLIGGTYQKEGISYQKTFIQKAFRTQSLGIELKKDYFTTDSLNFIVSKEETSQIRKFNATLKTEKGVIVQQQSYQFDKASNEIDLLFTGLKSNTKYQLILSDFLYENAIISDRYNIDQTYLTLKEKPTLGNPTFQIDKRNNLFTLSLDQIRDSANGITNYRYELYDARTYLEGDNEPIAVFDKATFGAVNVSVDEKTIQRGVPYLFKVITTFMDNEKEYEYESALSSVMKMDGVAFPTLRFQTEEVTFERIKGVIQIQDPSNTISLTGTKMTIVYTDSTGVSHSEQTEGSLAIPFYANGLRMNETYTISVYGPVNLQDGNEVIERCLIGSVVVKTGMPQSFLGKLNSKEDDLTNPFHVTFQLGSKEGIDNQLEARTLTGLTFSLYAGTGTDGLLVKKITKVDQDLREYESYLKNDYYDQNVSLTPEFFGLHKGDLTVSEYTIEVGDAYDYTAYKNPLPIENNQITVKTNGFVPDTPPEESSMDIQLIRNKDANKHYREDLNPETIVGYQVKANYDNSKKYARKVNYYLYNASGDQIASLSSEVTADGNLDYVTFYLEDGTSDQVDDSKVFRRGNKYYFGYEVWLDLNTDGTAETRYPLNTEETLHSPLIAPNKQEAKVEFYPSTSTNNTMLWKYRLTDIDHTIVDQKFHYGVNQLELGTTPIKETNSSFETIELTGLRQGTFYVSVKTKLQKQDKVAENVLVKQYFEGIVVPKALQFHVEQQPNRVIISLKDFSANQAMIQRISGLKVTFQAGEKSIVLDHLPLSLDSVVVDIDQIKEFKNQLITVRVVAYYDSGISGFETTDSKRYALQLASDTLGGEYQIINADGFLKGSSSANGSLYQVESFSDQLPLLKLNNLAYQRKLELIPQFDQHGFQYHYDYYLLKQLDSITFLSDGTEQFQFDRIIPGISLKDPQGKLQLTPTLRTIAFKANIYGLDASKIRDDEIFVQVYQTNETATTSQFVKEQVFSLTDLKQTQKIEGLNPNTPYYLRFYAYIQTNDGYVATQLYDLDDQSPNKVYYFSTLNVVDMREVEISYSPIRYAEKRLLITYDLLQTVGYDRIKYEVYRIGFDEAGNPFTELLDLQIPDDTIFKSKMVKSIPMPLAGALKPNETYRIVIQPIANVVIDGVEEEVELEKVVTSDYKIPPFNPPFIGVSSTATSTDGLEFKVSIYDNHKVIVDGVYQIRIVDASGYEITPAEYQGKDLSIDELNRVIKLNHLAKNSQYTLYVNTYVDMNNDIVSSTKLSKTFILRTVDDSGIDLGNVYTAKNSQELSKIDLLFYNSYKLTYIDTIRYSIYSSNGYAQDNEIPFVAKQIILESDHYYQVSLPELLPEKGLYYIQMQFIRDGQVIKDITLEHNYN